MAYYLTADDAAIAALNEANPISICSNRELRGLIFRTSGGAFGYTFPMVGGAYRTSLHNIVVPPNTTEVGHYHTHGAYTGPGASPGSTVRTSRDRAWRSVGPFGRIAATADVFGPEDLPTARRMGRGIPGYRSYLGTPSRLFYYYDVDTNMVGNLPRRPPRVVR